MALYPRVQRYRGTLRPPILFPFASPSGMRDSLDASTANERKARLIQNMYPQDPEIGGGLWGRPGFRPMGARLGSGGNRVGQRVYQYTKLDGTEHTVGFCGGLMYTFHWGTRAWTQVTLSGVSLNASAKVYCTTFANVLVVNPNDGVNKPWTWDGTTFTSLSNAPTLYGQPVVHYAKLVGIKWAERNTFAWSEEAQPNVGWEATIGAITYDNAWTLGQTEEEALYRLVSTNQALYYFRARSTGYVLGEVSDNWRSTGSLEGVSETIGTTSPDGVVVHDDKVYLIDADGHPQLMLPGGGYAKDPSPIWEDARETTRRLPRDKLVRACAVDWIPGNLVYFALTELGGDYPSHLLAFDADRGEFVAVMRGFPLSALDMVKDGDGVPTMVHLTEDGYAYEHGTPQGLLWSDELVGGTEPIEHRVIGGPQGWDMAYEKVLVGVDFAFRRASNLTDVRARITTPAGPSVELVLDVEEGGFSIYGLSVYGTDVYAPASLEIHVPTGWEEYGRGFQPEVRHSGVGEQFGLLGWASSVHNVGRVPETR